MKLVLYGVVAGILSALALTRFLATIRYGVAATDLPTFAGVAALVLGVAVLATVIPAWRATRIDPITALRAQ